jgi:hypothetical protein
VLTAIGVFAIRAAAMASASSGYDRQNTQNHYVSGAASSARPRLSTGRDAIHRAMTSGK